MTIRDGDIPTIFNPRRARAPSVVVTTIEEGGAAPSLGSAGNSTPVLTGTGAAAANATATGVTTVAQTGGGVSSANPGSGGATPPLIQHTSGANGPFITHADSVTSTIPDVSLGAVVSGGDLPLSPTTTVPPRGFFSQLKGCSVSLCSTSARKIYFGILVTVCMTASWVGATHCIKYLYLERPPVYEDTIILPQSSSEINITALQKVYSPNFQAPFCTTWFMTNWTMLFFPLYFLTRLGSTRCSSPTDILVESIRDFRDKGFTAGRFLTRCSLFCLLWVGTNYMYIRSLRILLATDVMALFATNVSCVYLLSWVILHEQFVGIRIMAVIMCDTGVALLAYMDGITGSPTLGGVVLAASAAAGSGVYKVLFRKVIGEATYGQVALFFTIIGMLNAALLWPLCLTLVLTGVETLHWERLPWPALLTASALSLVANLLGNFSVALTYDLFITLGLITAVPVSAALDVVLYGAQFEGMKLAGMILIAVGFFLVMFPDNWPDYITRLLRKTTRIFRGKKYHHVESQCEATVLSARGGFTTEHVGNATVGGATTSYSTPLATVGCYGEDELIATVMTAAVAVKCTMESEQTWCSRTPPTGCGGLPYRLYPVSSPVTFR